MAVSSSSTVQGTDASPRQLQAMALAYMDSRSSCSATFFVMTSNRTAAENVRVKACAGDILADRAADDDIRFIQHDVGHIALGDLDQLLFPLDQMLRGDSFDGVRLVVSVFEDGDAKADGSFLQNETGGLLNGAGKDLGGFLVHGRAALVVAKADDQHLAEAALDGR